jgi:hypothetical protein
MFQPGLIFEKRGFQNIEKNYNVSISMGVLILITSTLIPNGTLGNWIFEVWTKKNFREHQKN